MKKIYVSKFRWVEYYFMIAVSLFWIVVAGFTLFDRIIILVAKFGLSELIVRLLFTLSAPVIIMSVEWFGYGRELFHTVIDANGYQSYRFRKKHCYVDKHEEIYYSIFDFPYYKEYYIAFSNEPFKMFWMTYMLKNGLVLNYVQTYDYRKVIVLPYNQKTMLEFDIENWKEAEYVRLGQKNWKKKTIEVRDPNAKP